MLRQTDNAYSSGAESGRALSPAELEGVSVALPVATAAASQPVMRGIAALLFAFTTWGLIPLYLRLLQTIPPAQIIAYRLVFCCVLVLAFLQLRGELSSVWKALADPQIRIRLAASTVLLSINWLTLVWAINTARVLESSLGFFITPLVSVLLGVVVLSERLRLMQWVAVGIAAAGVVFLAVVAKAPPWIALVLAFSFGGYGLVRKTVGVESLVGLAAESLLATPLAIAYLFLCESDGTGVLSTIDAPTFWLLASGGLITAIPLWLFSWGVRRVPLTTVGILQYVGPTLQLLLGLFVYHEPFATTRAFGFAVIWTAIALYLAASWLQSAPRAQQVPRK